MTEAEPSVFPYSLIFWLHAPGSYDTSQPVVDTVAELDRMLIHLSRVEQAWPVDVWSPDLPVAGPLDLPTRQFKLVVRAGRPPRVGAAVYLDEEGLWVSHRPWRMAAPPVLHQDSTTGAEFPTDAVISNRAIKSSLVEFAWTGERPKAVAWRPWDVF